MGVAAREWMLAQAPAPAPVHGRGTVVLPRRGPYILLMRYALAAVLLLLVACATGGVGEPVIDAAAGNAPFALVSGGFDRLPGRAPQTTTEGMTFVFRNVTDKPQRAESLFISQANEASSRLQVKRASTPIGKVILPGEEVEVKMAPTVVFSPPGETLGPKGVELDVLLRADGTSYRYPLKPSYPHM